MTQEVGEFFFRNLMIRATPLSALNDPYEGEFNGNQVRDADRNHREYYKNNRKDIYEADDSMIDNSIGSLQNELSELGIISFSEDFNNPLMWSHYANEHYGIVVEFDFKEPFFMDSIHTLEGRKYRFGKSHFADCFEFPEKVDYRRKMPSFERPELSAPDTIEGFPWLKFIRTILFTKANDWIYEKEQRSVVRLKDADSIICKDYKYIRKQCCSDSAIKLEKLKKNGKLQIIYPNEYEMHEEMGDKSLKNEIFRTSFSPQYDSMYLFRINPLAISAIYFGCKSECEVDENTLKIIRDNPSLMHLNNIYKMQRNEFLYQLDNIKLLKNNP